MTPNTPPAKANALFETDRLSAIQAISQAQFIAFAPYVFQASIILRDSGILKQIEDAHSIGISMETIGKAVNMPHYGIRVLLEAGLGIGLVYRKEHLYFLSKLGHFFLNHPMTRINTDFMRDVCYKGAEDLAVSLQQEKPIGLKHLGDWETIYQGLSILPQPANNSWFAFDHFYSDTAFPEALPIVFATHPRRIMDIGANTGKFTLACLYYNADVAMGLVDLKIQLDVAHAHIQAENLSHRVSFHECDVLQPGCRLPEGFDTIWMSQFLDCFSDKEIIHILQKCHDALPEDGQVFINETFWDVQRFEASAFSLQMTSLYFTTIANGNSQMYDSKVFIEFIHQAGFKIINQVNNIGLSHTLLHLKKK
jgi:hypothetical protein